MRILCGVGTIFFLWAFTYNNDIKFGLMGVFLLLLMSVGGNDG